MFARALLLLVVTLLVSLPAWTIPELHGTEGQRAQIAAEMMRSGDWLVPTMGGEPIWTKPPLHYWMLGAAMQLLGDGRMVLRLPSVLLLFAAAMLAGELLRRHFGSAAGWIGALALLCSPMVAFQWPSAEIDPVFASLTAMSLWSLATGVARERVALVVASGVFAGLALLDKGPPFFLFAIGAYIVWWRHRGVRHALAHFLPALLIPLAYYAAVWLFRVSPEVMLAVAREESVGRLGLFDRQSLSSIPSFWLRAVLVQMPFALWCLWEWRGPRDARMDAGDLTLRMCSGAAVLGVVLLTFFPGRPTRYLLPNVMLFTFAVSPAVAHFFAWRGALPRTARLALSAWGLMGAVALVVIPFVPQAGVASLAVALCAAAAPLVVRTCAHLVVLCLLTPVIGAWTVGMDLPVGRGESARNRNEAARVLVGELRQLGVGGDVSTFGHFDSALLMAMGSLLPGDPQKQRTPTSKWVLFEAAPGLERLADYRPQLCLDLEFKTFCAAELSKR